jgi:hypothetical protein
MALIHCPECNNQISDKAPTCPQCGYPLQINALANLTAQSFIDQVLRRFMVLFAGISMLVGAAYWGYPYIVEQVYLANVNAIVQDIETTFADAENIAAVTEKTWVLNGSESTFSYAQSRLSEDTMQQIVEIKAKSMSIENRIVELEAPAQYKNLHDELIAVHDIFLRYVDLTTNHSGSYASYTEAVATTSERFVETFRTFKQKMP